MKLSKRLRIALAVLPELIDVRGFVSGESLAGQCGIRYGYLSCVLVKLSRGGVLVGSRGGRGGYRLARDPKSITLLDVIWAMEGLPFDGQDQSPAASRANRLLREIITKETNQWTLWDLARARKVA